jgi:recombination DNA repair RAD52 pathway protein
VDDDVYADEFDKVAPAFADLNDPNHFDLVDAPAVEIAGVDNVIDAEEDNDELDNDEHDIAIAELDNDNVNAVNNENEQQIDPNINPEQLNPELNLHPEQLTIEQKIDDEPDPNIDQIMDEQYGPRSNAYNLRPRKPREYSHLHAVLEETVVTQHFMKPCIKLWVPLGWMLYLESYNSCMIGKLLSLFLQVH